MKKLLLMIFLILVISGCGKHKTADIIPESQYFSHPLAFRDDGSFIELEEGEFNELVHTLRGYEVKENNEKYEAVFQFVKVENREVSIDNQLSYTEVHTDDKWSEICISESGYVRYNDYYYKTDHETVRSLLKLYNDALAQEIEIHQLDSPEFLMVNPFIVNMYSDYSDSAEVRQFKSIINELENISPETDKVAEDVNARMFYSGGFMGVGDNCLILNGKSYKVDKDICIQLKDLYDQINGAVLNPVYPFENISVSDVETKDANGSVINLEGGLKEEMIRLLKEIRIYDVNVGEDYGEWGLRYIATVIDSAGSKTEVYAGKEAVKINDRMYHASSDSSINLINLINAIRGNDQSR